MPYEIIFHLLVLVQLLFSHLICCMNSRYVNMVRFIKGFTVIISLLEHMEQFGTSGPIFLIADSDRTGNLGSDWLLQ